LPNINGAFTFASFSTFIANTPVAAGGLSLADGPPSFNFKEQDVAFYSQDDWRVKDNLTLNLGMRWEWFQQAINLLHDITLANQAASVPFWNATLPESITTIPKVDQDLNNFGP